MFCVIITNNMYSVKKSSILSEDFSVSNNSLVFCCSIKNIYISHFFHRVLMYRNSSERQVKKICIGMNAYT